MKLSDAQVRHLADLWRSADDRFPVDSDGLDPDFDAMIEPTHPHSTVDRLTFNGSDENAVDVPGA